MPLVGGRSSGSLERRDELDAADRGGCAAPRLRGAERPGGVPVAATSRGRPRTGRRKPSGRLPLVSVVIPYFALDRYIEDTLRSIFEQDHPRLEVIVVNDGSLRREDVVLAELAGRYPMRVLTKENAGSGRARNFGIAPEPRALRAPARRRQHDRALLREPLPRGARATSAPWPTSTTWSRYVDEEGTPLDRASTPATSRSATLVGACCDDNVAGDATAVIRRRIFDLGYRYSPDLTSYEDWQLYRELSRGRTVRSRHSRSGCCYTGCGAGRCCARSGCTRTGRLFGEMRALLRERQIEWESKSD